MRNIKNNINISNFDDFLCKLEKKEEFGCFIIRCGKAFDERCASVYCTVNIECRYGATSEQHTVDEQNDEYELDTDDEQNEEHELDTDDKQDDEYELDIDDEQDEEHEPEE